MAEQMTRGFRNENTIWNLKQAGRLDEFHGAYERALAEVRKELGKTYANLVDGKRAPGRGGTFDDTNPSNAKELVAKFPASTAADAQEAIAAAKRAYPAWSAPPFARRAEILRQAGQLLRQRKYEFAAWMTVENGKNRTEAMNDVDEAIDFLAYYPLEYESNQGYSRALGKPFPNEDCRSVLKPYGVWAVISPFNFPVAITVGMTTGAILTGNTAVLKPASDTPLVAFKFVELLLAAGVPGGAINLVTGGGSTVGQALLDSPDVAGVVFTGSRDVGLKVLEASVRHGRPAITEQGGKNPILVTAKADLDKAVEGVGRSAFGYSGQKCSAASRVFVERNIKPDFTRRLVEWTKQNAIVGDPEKAETMVGPVINKAAHANYLSFIEKAKKGGKVLWGGRSAATGALANGHFVEPTILDELADGHWITCNELFVPIVSLYAFETLEEAVRRANAVEFGLTAGIFTEDAPEREYFFDHIEAGVAYSNRRIGGSTGAIVGGQSFGGWKHSGSTGRGAGGPWYLQQFLREQSQTRVS